MAAGVWGVSWAKPTLSLAARRRMLRPSTSYHRSSRIAPIRCPVSCATTRNLTYRAALLVQGYPLSLTGLLPRSSAGTLLG